MRYSFSILLLITLLRSKAQLPDYYVDLVTGTVTITKPGGKPVAAKYKQLVYKNDKITITKGAELTLVDREAGFYVLNIPGIKTATEWVKKATRKSKDGVTSSYMKLLFHELLDPNQDFDKFKKENVAGVWGGVSRGDDCRNRILPIDGYKTSATTIVFKWHKTSPSSLYSFEVYDHENKPAGKKEIKDTSITLNIAESLNAKPGIYKWRVISADGNCEDQMPIYFELLAPDNEQKLVEQLTTGIANDGLEKQLQQVDRLEKNGLIDAASSRYAGIVKANNDDKALLKSYIAFLLKYGFEEKAKEAWKP